MVIHIPSMFLRIQYIYVHDALCTYLAVYDLGCTDVQTDFSVT